MGFGNCIVANQTPENEEVLGGAGLFYRKNDVSALSEKLKLVLDCPQEVYRYRRLARERACSMYSWDHVVAAYDTLFQQVLQAR